MGAKKGLKQRLQDGEHVLVAEGFLFEVEQRGYMQAGHFVPEVALEHPDALRGLHEEFAHAGSDVVEAFTYYGQRAKLEIAGRKDQVEQLNRAALRIAKGVADATDTLMAGNICNSTIFQPNNAKLRDEIEGMFKEQVVWAAEEGADFMIGETYFFLEEAMIALDAIKKYGRGMPAVITLPLASRGPTTYDGVPIWDACRKLEEAGADVVGVNCFRGPATTLPYMPEIRRACKGPIACLPVPYRTNETWPRMMDLKCPTTGKDCFPGNLNPWHCSRYEIEDFTKKAKEIGIQYLGLCCGNQAHYMRTMAETLGRSPPASKYSPDMTKHFSRIEGERFKSEREMYARQYE